VLVPRELRVLAMQALEQEQEPLLPVQALALLERELVLSQQEQELAQGQEQELPPLLLLQRQLRALLQPESLQV
jgi:hypothetical protein